MPTRDRGVGVAVIENWTRWLPEEAAVLDLCAGPGGPRSAALFRRGFSVYAVRSEPAIATAYRKRFPAARVACEPLDQSPFFARSFHGILAWGLLFLLPAEKQLKLIGQIAEALMPRGHFLFTVPAQNGIWQDRETGLKAESLGERAYAHSLRRSGLTLFAQHLDEADITYYAAIKG